MNEQIIFIAIYRALECLEEETGNKEISAYLDKANPYVFKDRKSADPAVYNDFIEWANSKKIDFIHDNSYIVAKKYISDMTSFLTIFEDIEEAEWSDLIEIIKKEEPDLSMETVTPK